MKEIIYYGRDHNKRPVVTVCLIENTDGYSRGVAACSEQDNPCKRVGRKIAKERALYAARTKKNNCVIDTVRGMNSLKSGGINPMAFGYLKSGHNMPLTKFETELIFGEF